MMKAKDAQGLSVVDAVYEPADFLEKSVQFAAQIISGKAKIERTDYTSDLSAWDKAMETGKAAIAKKYGGADIEAPRRALELIYAARTNTLDQGFDAEDEILANLVMGNPLRASVCI